MLLSVKDLRTCFYNEGAAFAAVDGVSFSVLENSVCGLVGESGCGKTITALSITRLLPHADCRVAAGRIEFEGEDLAAADEKRLRGVRGSKISYVFQEPSTALNPVLTVGEQIREVLETHGVCARGQSRSYAVRLLEETGIEPAGEKIGRYPHQLSGGEKQRVMIAMAVAARPKLLIADEPTTALDVTVQANILRLLAALKQKYGLAILMISHDLNVIGIIADYIGVMYAGQIVEHGRAKLVLSSAKHPYTQGLLKCLPQSHSGKKEKLCMIPGEVPKAGQIPRGCRFHPRCPFVFKACAEKMPPMLRAASGQEVRCWLYSTSGN